MSRARGRIQVGRGRPRVHRLLVGPRRAAARPQPPGDRRGGQEQMARGTHLRRAQRLRDRVGRAGPAAGPVGRARQVHRRGTEATMMALRLARAFTGKPKSSSSPGTSTAGTTTSTSASTRRTTCRRRPACPTQVARHGRRRARPTTSTASSAPRRRPAISPP